jgi:hypothetical protein
VAANEFAGQSSHAAAPEPSLYFPDRHSTHVVPSGPVVPGLHLQSDRNADSRGIRVVGTRLAGRTPYFGPRANPTRLACFAVNSALSSRVEPARALGALVPSCDIVIESRTTLDAGIVCFCLPVSVDAEALVDVTAPRHRSRVRGARHTRIDIHFSLGCPVVIHLARGAGNGTHGGLVGAHHTRFARAAVWSRVPAETLTAGHGITAAGRDGVLGTRRASRAAVPRRVCVLGTHGARPSARSVVPRVALAARLGVAPAKRHRVFRTRQAIRGAQLRRVRVGGTHVAGACIWPVVPCIALAACRHVTAAGRG